MITHTHYLTLIRLSIVMALCVIMLGAYVRLSDAGLGCPDWPGCYGKMLVPQHDSHVDEANQAWSQRPLEQDKAWKEMVHRYLAGFLGLAILLVAIAGWRLRRRLGQSPVLPLAILGLVVVTLLLLAGVALWALRTGHRAFRLPAVAVLVLLVLQVTLGVMNIVHVLPLPIAVAHNGGAALLLISVATLLYHASSINHPVRP
jgi:heme A synthase